MEKKADHKLIIKPTLQLSKLERKQINIALQREFKVPFELNEQTKDRLFFLLKEQDRILAMGALWEIYPVIFSGHEFSLYAVLNIVANEKGKGYGKQIVTSLRRYAEQKRKTILGFCAPKNSRFYEKCGFQIAFEITSRFVCQKGNKRFVNQDGQIIFYQDGIDQFMKKVLNNSKLKVSIPTNQLW